MKNKVLFALLTGFALLAGCIKNEGEDLLTRRTDVTDSTIVTEQGGYMVGVAAKDVVTENDFEKDFNGITQIEELNCYTELRTEFKGLDATRNGNVTRAGYVYSRKNRVPVITDKKDCQVVYAQNPAVSGTEASFSSKLNKLEPNSTYYVRSFVVCEGDGKRDSVIYNSNILSNQTVLPEDVWVQRSNAPAPMLARTNPFVCRVDFADLGINEGNMTKESNLLAKDSTVFLYGGRNNSQCSNDMWYYDSAKDTWQQLSSFDNPTQHYTGTERRCNGAMFAYPVISSNNSRLSDVLLYIAGGELSSGAYTNKVIFYSIKNNRYADQTDHPNHDYKTEKKDQDGNIMYQYEYKTDEQGNMLTDDYGNPLPELDANGKIKYITDHNGEKIPMTTNAGRPYVQDLPLYNGSGADKIPRGLAGCVAFSLSDGGETRFYVAFGKNDLDGTKHIHSMIYEYNVHYDRTCNEITEYSDETWKSKSFGDDKTAEGFYQPVCIKCGSRVIIGSGESSRDNQVAKRFYSFTYQLSNNKLLSEPIPGNNDPEFSARANAAGFYLNYTKGGSSCERFYVGTGRNCTEEEFGNSPDQLLNDFWCYDFGTRQWSRKADCSNIKRQGAVGFKIMRKDDIFVKNNYSVNERGMFSFGDGYIPLDGYKSALNDNWEYIP